MNSNAPFVSICIPTYQGAPWIRETLASALAQDYPAFEVVVSDDCSTDGTVDIAATFQDKRLRILRSDRRLGMAANWNRSIQAARGEFIKLLMQDDLLDIDCVSTMAALLDRDSSIGFVFSSRRLHLEALNEVERPGSQVALGFLHRELEPLTDINAGPRLVSIMRRERFKGNRIGEPTVVMVRRSAFRRAGLFNLRLRQLTDLEMWLRLAAFDNVGFVRRPLATFRVHPLSASVRNNQSAAAWMDRVWMVEGLRQHPSLQAMVGPRLRLRIWAGMFKREALRQLTRVLTGRRPEGTRLGKGVLEYLHWLRTKPRQALHGTLGDSEPAKNAPSG